MNTFFSTIATRLAVLAGQPRAFVAASASMVLWAVCGPFFGYSDTWQLVLNTATSIVTFLMVFVIQNSQNRDSAAIQAKLDELIRTMSDARNEFIGIEQLTEHELQAIRTALQSEARASETQVASEVDRLLGRGGD